MTAVKTKVKPGPGRRRSRITAAGIAVMLLAAVVLRQAFIAGLIAIAVVAVAVFVLRRWWVWHRAGGTAARLRRGRFQGLAAGRELGRHLSRRSVRKRAAVTSPGLHPSEAPVVIASARRRGRRRVLAASREDSYLTAGPVRCGKTGLLACWAADAPGALLATSTRTDLYAHTAVPRRRAGDILVLNPGGDGGLPSTLEWSPLDGCADPATAIERAGYLMAAAPRSSTGDDAWHVDRGAKLLRYLLHSAAIAGASMREVKAWACDVLSGEPRSILASRGTAGWAEALESLLAHDGDYLASVVTAAESALGWMDDPAMARAACPAGDGFDAAGFLAEGTGSVYLVGADKPHGSLAPYFACFAAHLFETAKHLASASPGGRLPRPLTLALDEAAITCPVPLHKWMSEAGGHGVTVMAAVQALSQLRSRWGEEDGRTIFANATVKVVFGGLADHADLEALSAVCGDRDTWDHVRHADGSKSRQPRQERAVPPERIRLLGPMRVLVLHRSTRPVIARVTPVWGRAGYQPAPLGGFPVPASRPALEAPRGAVLPAAGAPHAIAPAAPEEIPCSATTSA